MVNPTLMNLSSCVRLDATHTARTSVNAAQSSTVFNHCKAANHTFKPEEVVILDKIERGIHEAIWERVEQPALNKKRTLFSAVARIGWGDQTSFLQIIMWPIRGLMKSGVSRCNVTKWVANFFSRKGFKYIWYQLFQMSRARIQCSTKHHATQQLTFWSHACELTCCDDLLVESLGKALLL